MQGLVDSLYGTHVSLCINAVWALGQITEKNPQLLANVLETAVTRLRRILQKNHNSSLLRNVSITLTRLVPLCAPQLAGVSSVVSFSVQTKRELPFRIFRSESAKVSH
jgi:hypothetical protein